MKITFALAAALALTLAPAAARADEEAARPGRSPRVERGSYAFAYDLARTLRERGVSLDAEQLARGLEDGLAGRPAPMSQKDLQKALAAFQGELRVKQELARRRAAAERQAEVARAARAEAGRSAP
jgi:hypothetical protein